MQESVDWSWCWVVIVGADGVGWWCCVVAVGMVGECGCGRWWWCVLGGGGY